MGFCCCCDAPNPEQSDHKLMTPMQSVMSEESEEVVLSDKPVPPNPKLSPKPSPKPSPKVAEFNFDMGTGKMEFTSYPNGGMESMKENIN